MENVTDFKYLGSWVNSATQDVKTRKALAWKALNDMKMVWRSNISRELKLKFFCATVEAVLLYGSECWTMNASLQKSPDASYTRMLQVVLNVTTGATPFATVTSTETSLRFQTKSLGGDSGLRATVSGTRSSRRTTLYCGNQPMANVAQEDPRQHL